MTAGTSPAVFNFLSRLLPDPFASLFPTILGEAMAFTRAHDLLKTSFKSKVSFPTYKLPVLLTAPP